MSWRLFFRFGALVLFVSGLIGLIAPDQYLSRLDVAASVGGRLWGRSMGAVALGLSAVVWLGGGPRYEQARRPAAIGVLVAFALNMLVDIVSTVGGDLPAIGWSFVVLNGAIAALAGWFLASESRHT